MEMLELIVILLSTANIALLQYRQYCTFFLKICKTDFLSLRLMVDKMRLNCTKFVQKYTLSKLWKN